MNKSIFTKLILEHLYINQNKNIQYFYSDTVPEIFVKFANAKGIEIDIRMDAQKFRETFWELIIKGLVIPGGKGDSRFPLVSITEYGIRCYEEGKILPYDPEGLLNSLNEEIPQLDKIIKMYFEEAVDCYSRMNYLASTVMIGGALEKMVLYLIDEEFEKMLMDEVQKTSFSKIKKINKIKTKFDKFLDFIKRNKIEKQFSKTLEENLLGFLPSVVQLIRITRNEVGHPTGREIKRDEAEAYILLTKQGIIFCYELLDEIEGICKSNILEQF